MEGAGELRECWGWDQVRVRFSLMLSVLGVGADDNEGIKGTRSSIDLVVCISDKASTLFTRTMHAPVFLCPLPLCTPHNRSARNSPKSSKQLQAVRRPICPSIHLPLAPFALVAAIIPLTLPLPYPPNPPLPVIPKKCDEQESYIYQAKRQQEGMAGIGIRAAEWADGRGVGEGADVGAWVEGEGGRDRGYDVDGWRHGWWVERWWWRREVWYIVCDIMRVLQAQAFMYIWREGGQRREKVEGMRNSIVVYNDFIVWREPLTHQGRGLL